MIRSLAFAAALAAAPVATAATYDVFSLADSGTGSLREAIGFANASPGVPDIITFSVSGTITLTTGQLVITDTVAVQGPGARQLTIDGNINDRILETQGAATNVLLQGLTLTRGLTNGNGGAILNNGGDLTLLQMRVTENQTGAEGGAIYDPFTATSNFLIIVDSEISINRATKNAGIFYSGFELRIFNSTIYNNIATDSVGGILVQGGFANIVNSTIAFNNAQFVGGIQSQDSTVTFESTIVANNTDSTGINDINRIGSGTVNSTTTLFTENVSATSVINGTDLDNLILLDPLLEVFGNNGGPTNSLRPGPLSPVIGFGSNPLNLEFDQRGPGFPRDAGGAVDIGAIQAFAAPPPPTVPVPTLAPAALGALSLLLAAAGLARRRRG